MTRTLLKMTGIACWSLGCLAPVAVGAAQRRGAGQAAVRKRPGVLSRRPLCRSAEGLSDGRRRLRDLHGRRRRDARDCRVSTRRAARSDCGAHLGRDAREAVRDGRTRRRWATSSRAVDAGARSVAGRAWTRRWPASTVCRGCFREARRSRRRSTTRPRSIGAPVGPATRSTSCGASRRVLSAVDVGGAGEPARVAVAAGRRPAERSHARAAARGAALRFRRRSLDRTGLEHHALPRSTCAARRAAAVHRLGTLDRRPDGQTEGRRSHCARARRQARRGDAQRVPAARREGRGLAADGRPPTRARSPFDDRGRLFDRAEDASSGARPIAGWRGWRSPRRPPRGPKLLQDISAGARLSTGDLLVADREARVVVALRHHRQVARRLRRRAASRAWPWARSDEVAMLDSDSQERRSGPTAPARCWRRFRRAAPATCWTRPPIWPSTCSSTFTCSTRRRSSSSRPAASWSPTFTPDAQSAFRVGHRAGTRQRRPALYL